MTSRSEKLQHCDQQKFKENGYEEIIKSYSTSQLKLFIQKQKDYFQDLQTYYYEYYQKGFFMCRDLKCKLKRIICVIKGFARYFFIDKIVKILLSLNYAVDQNNRNEIDKYMYEAFAFMKNYFECLYALIGENIDEPEFDLRQFDEFTHLSLASNYQRALINTKSFTFSKIGNQCIANKISSHEHQKKKVLVSENRNEVVEKIKQKKEIQAAVSSILLIKRRIAVRNAIKCRKNKNN